jgi:hypothetical protein
LKLERGHVGEMPCVRGGGKIFQKPQPPGSYLRRRWRKAVVDYAERGDAQTLDSAGNKASRIVVRMITG